jgi:hypothetical protein
MQLRFLLRNLTRFHNEHLVLILKHKNTSWLVMSTIKKYQTLLTYVLKYLIVLNLGASRVMSLLVLFKAFACLVLIFWSPWISPAECNRSSFALIVSYVQLRNCFLFLAMPTRVVCGKSKLMRVGLYIGILRLRALMDDILF